MRKSVLFLGSALILFSIAYFSKSLDWFYSPPITATAPPAIDPYAIYEPLMNDYSDYFKTSCRKAGVPGAALVIVKDTTVILVESYGRKSVYLNGQIDSNTVFRIGSLSKGFSGILCSQMAQEGHLELSEKVTKILPNFILKDRIHTNQVAVEDLLSHTSGLPYHAYTNLIEVGLEIDEIIQQLKTVNLIGPPGAVYAYQNVAFGVVEPILEQKTGIPFNYLMEEKIFKSLGMDQASITYDNMMATQNKAMPHQYSRRKKRWFPTKITPKYYNLPSAGGINASISDMAQWMKHLMNDSSSVISQEAKKAAFSPLIETDIKNRYYRNWHQLESASYGLGWRILTLKNGQKVVHHGGYVNEFRGEIAMNLDEKIGICILFNAPSSSANSCIPMFWKKYRQFQDTLNVPPPGFEDELILELEQT